MLRWVISIKTTTNIYFGERLKRLNNQTKFDSTKHKLWTESCESSEGSALGDTLSTTNLLDWYYFLLFQDCVNMLFTAYSILFSHFGKWDFMCEYHQCRIWTERLHIGGSCPLTENDTQLTFKAPC